MRRYHQLNIPGDQVHIDLPGCYFLLLKDPLFRLLSLYCGGTILCHFRVGEPVYTGSVVIHLFKMITAGIYKFIGDLTLVVKSM